MDEPRESNGNLKWVIILGLLLIGINGLLTRLLEELWLSLRDNNSPAYLPLKWWMSAPFTLFVFAILSALFTSFSGVNKWLNTFLSLCGLKVVFAGVTAGFFIFLETYPSVAESILQATLLSLPSVLVHILLSGTYIMLARGSFAGEPLAESLDFPYAEGAEPEEVPPPMKKPLAQSSGKSSAIVLEEEVGPALPGVPEEALAGETEEDYLLLPVSELAKSFPEGELAVSASELEELCPSLRIPLEVIVSQLPEGIVEVDALVVISAMPREAFWRPPEEVARQFPDGKMELPLWEVVPRIPPGVFEPPEQRAQPDVDSAFPDPFHEVVPAAAEKPFRKLAPVIEAPAEEEEEEEAVSEEPSEVAEELPDEALVLTEEERLKFERSREVVEVSASSILRQFPDGTVSFVNSGEAPQVPDTLLVPVEFIVPQLSQGEVKLKAKYVLAQIPENCLLISESEIIRSLPNGEVELPLHEIVPQLRSGLLAPPPDQIEQPSLEEMPAPFREVARPEALKEEAPAPPGKEAPPEPVSAPKPIEKPTPISYSEALREENPLSLSVETVVNLLPEGSFEAPVEQLKEHLDGGAAKVPRSMVVRQLKEGRVVVPVEILTVQFDSEDFAMSVEQIKARFAEGVVELPLRDIVEQVLEEVGRPLESQKVQPACEEISPPFHEIPQGAAAVTETPPGGPEPTEETMPAEEIAAASPTLAREDVAREEPVEPPPPEVADSQEREVSVAATGTILDALLQKCSGLGFSRPKLFVAENYSVAVLAPSSLHRQAAACGMIEIMAPLRRFCGDCGLGEPRKLVICSTAGAVVGRQPVSGEGRGMILLASLDPSSAGFMSLLLDALEGQPDDLSSLTGANLERRPVDRSLNLNSEKVLLRADGSPEEACRKVVDHLRELGMEKCVSLRSPDDQKFLAVWGEGGYGEKILNEGFLDIELFSRYCRDVSVGEFESFLLTTQDVTVTLNKSGVDPSLHLLCLFSKKYGVGLVRAKANKGLKLLEA